MSSLVSFSPQQQKSGTVSESSNDPSAAISMEDAKLEKSSSSEILDLIEEMRTVFPDMPRDKLSALFKKYYCFTQIPDPFRSEMDSFTLAEYQWLSEAVKKLEGGKHPQLLQMVREIQEGVQSAYELRKKRCAQNGEHLAQLSDLINKIEKKGTRYQFNCMEKWPAKGRIELLGLASRVYFDWHEPFAFRIDFENFLAFYEKDPLQNLDPESIARLKSCHSVIAKIAQPMHQYKTIFDSLSADGKKQVIQERFDHLLERRKEEKTGPRTLILGAGSAGMMRALVAQQKNSSVYLIDQRASKRTNIVKLNKNNYLAYFPIYQILSLENEAATQGPFIFSKIATFEKAMEVCLCSLGVVPDREKAWVGLEIGDKAICILKDAKQKKEVLQEADLIVDTMGVHTPLARFLHIARKEAEKDLVIVAKYKSIVAPKEEHPSLKEHMVFEDKRSSTTLSMLKGSEKPAFRSHFDAVQALKKELRELESLPSTSSYLLSRVYKELREKEEALAMMTAQLLPETEPLASSPQCVEAGITKLEKSALSIGETVIEWAGDSLATGHPREGQGINIALRAGAFAHTLHSFAKGKKAETIVRDYEYGSLIQIDQLIGDSSF